MCESGFVLQIHKTLKISQNAVVSRVGRQESLTGHFQPSGRVDFARLIRHKALEHARVVWLDALYSQTPRLLQLVSGKHVMSQ